RAQSAARGQRGDPARPVRRFRGTERLRQADAAQADRRAARAQLRADHRRCIAGHRAEPGDRRDVPDAGALPVAHRPRERAAADRGLRARAPRRHRESAGHPAAGGARGPRRRLSARALGRHAAARGAQPGAGDRPVDHPHGRAVRSARRVHARADEPRAAAHLAGARADDHLRHAQHQRGGVPRRSRRRHGHRARARARRGRRAAAAAALDRAHEIAAVRGQDVRSTRVPGGGPMSRGAVLSPLSLVMVIVLWEMACRAGLVSPLVLPAPSRIWDGLVILFTAPWFPQHIWYTTAETLIGFFIGGIVAIALGIVMVNLPLFKEVIYPYVVAFQVMPKVVLAPLMITWFGFGIESKIVMAIAIWFFPVVINTVV